MKYLYNLYDRKTDTFLNYVEHPAKPQHNTKLRLLRELFKGFGGKKVYVIEYEVVNFLGTESACKKTKAFYDIDESFNI